MNLRDVLTTVYEWCDAHAARILLAGIVLPVAGTGIAWLGKGGRTDQDGRRTASLVVAASLVFLILGACAVSLGVTAFDRSVLDANVLLLLAPVLCIALALLGVRLVFPLGELASVRTAVDVGVFLAACAATLWLLSKFRGFGVLFLGGIAQLAAIGLFAWVLLQRLYRRAFGERATAGAEGA